MSELAGALVIAAARLGGALVVRGTFGTDRFDLVPAGGGSVYRLDRLTGSGYDLTRVAAATSQFLSGSQPDSTAH